MNANEREYEKILFKEEVFRIIGAAIEVSNNLGCGFLEAVYQEALEIEFSDSAIPFESQKRIPVVYKNRILSKEYASDFFKISPQLKKHRL